MIKKYMPPKFSNPYFFQLFNDFYQNENVVINQKKLLEKSINSNQIITRDRTFWFIICEKGSEASQ